MAINTKTIASWILALALVVALPLQALAGTDYALCIGLLNSQQGPLSRDFFIPHLKFLPGGGMELERKEGWRVLGAARIPTKRENHPGTERLKMIEYVFNDIPNLTELRRRDGTKYSVYNFARVQFHFDDQGRLERVFEVIRQDAGYETGRQIRSEISLDADAAIRDRRKPQDAIDAITRIESGAKRREWTFRHFGDRCVPEHQSVQGLDRWGDPLPGDSAKLVASSTWCGPLQAFLRANPSILECGADLMIERAGLPPRPAAFPPQCRDRDSLKKLEAILPQAYTEKETFGIATAAVKASHWCENPSVSSALGLF
ncbi:MAG TPA: hypothetical protein VM598_11150, partial [Bdellovibrionota bacterium]|nr:hypothetical protein [Bdellovibrionota bacterium]